MRLELDQDIGRLLDELGSLADEPVTAARERIVDRARNREHLAAMVHGLPRGDQRAAAPRRLDDERAERQARDDAIALREEQLLGLDAGRVFRHEQAACRDVGRELRVRAGKHDVDTAAEYGDGAPKRRQRPAMACAVDARREPARDRQAALAEIACELLRGFSAAGRGAATTDDRELRRRQQLELGPFDPKRERRVVELREAVRIRGAAERDECAVRSGEPLAPAFDGLFVGRS